MQSGVDIGAEAGNNTVAYALTHGYVDGMAPRRRTKEVVDTELVRLNINLPGRLMARLERFAKATRPGKPRTSKTAIVELALDEYLSRQEAQESSSEH